MSKHKRPDPQPKFIRWMVPPQPPLRDAGGKPVKVPPFNLDEANRPPEPLWGFNCAGKLRQM